MVPLGIECCYFLATRWELLYGSLLQPSTFHLYWKYNSKNFHPLSTSMGILEIMKIYFGSTCLEKTAVWWRGQLSDKSRSYSLLFLRNVWYMLGQGSPGAIVMKWAALQVRERKWNHFSPQVCGKIVFHRTGPGAKKVGDHCVRI